MGRGRPGARPAPSITTFWCRKRELQQLGDLQREECRWDRWFQTAPATNSGGLRGLVPRWLGSPFPSTSGAGSPGGRGAPGRSPQAARALACRIHPPAALKLPGFSPPPPPARAPTSRPASWVTRRDAGISKALYHERPLQRAALSGSGPPRARGGAPLRLAHAGGAVPPAPTPQVRRGARLESVHNSRRAATSGTAAGVGARGGAGVPSLRGALGLGAGERRPSPPPGGRYSRSRLSRQSAVQPRGIPRPARAPRPPSILPEPLRTDAQSPRRARPGPGAPAPPPGSGVGDPCFSPPLSLHSWQGRPLSLAAPDVRFPVKSPKLRTLGGRLGWPAASEAKKGGGLRGPRCLVGLYGEAPSYFFKFDFHLLLTPSCQPCWWPAQTFPVILFIYFWAFRSFVL